MKLRLGLLLAAAVSAQSTNDPSAVLALARQRILDGLEHLPRYTCTETVNRLIYKQPKPPRTPGSCDDLAAQKRRGLLPVTLVATDRLRLDVAVAENGREIYSWPGARTFESSRLDNLILTGPLGTGPFGPLLIDTFGQSAIEFHFRNGTEYWYRVPQAMSHYRVLSGGRERIFAYDGTAQIDTKTAQLLSMTARTGFLPSQTGICEATTAIDFQTVHIGKGDYLLPRESRLRFIDRQGNESENATTYESCREFRGEASLSFDDPSPSKSPSEVASIAPALPVSAGIEITLSLDTLIDTATAAAGDPVTAKLDGPFSDKLTDMHFPAGALVQGRIQRIEHHIEAPAYFLISIGWSSIETDNKSYPFAARFSKEMQKQNKLPFAEEKRDYFPVRSAIHESPASAFIFATRAPNQVMKRGFPMALVTTPPRNHESPGE